MVDADVMAAKLAEPADRIHSDRPADAQTLAADRDVLDLVSFNLMLAVQACTDVASHLIADEGWPPACETSSPASTPRPRPYHSGAAYKAPGTSSALWGLTVAPSSAPDRGLGARQPRRRWLRSRPK